MAAHAELSKLYAEQVWALEQHLAGNSQAVLGMSDLLAEEVLIRCEEGEDATRI